MPEDDAWNSEKDIRILHKIVKYCDRVRAHMERFGEDENQYLGDIGYKDACSLCIAQIGELCGRISPMVRTAFPYVEWSRIKGLRNIINHDYGVIDDSMMWFFLHDQVAELRRSCLDIIRTLERTQRYDDPRR